MSEVSKANPTATVGARPDRETTSKALITFQLTGTPGGPAAPPRSHVTVRGRLIQRRA